MSDTTKSVLKIIVVTAFIAFGIGAFFTKNIIYYAAGIAVGTAISLARVILLERTLKKSLDMPPQNAQTYVASQYSLRMVCIVVIVFIALKTQRISLIGLIIGLLLVQPSIYIHGLLDKKNGSDPQ